MKWTRVEREITFQNTGSQLYEVRTVVGWECSACHHINWAPRHPGVGCWSCGQRDEELGHDAVAPGAHRPAEALGEVRRPPDPATVSIECPTCGRTITLYPDNGLVEAAEHAAPPCAAWVARDISVEQLYQAYVERQKPQTTRSP